MRPKFTVHLAFFMFSLTLVALVQTACGPGSLEQVIRSYQYREVVPASLLLPPGTIVVAMQDKPLVLERICSAKAALGPNISPESSAAPLTDIEQKLKHNSGISAGYLALIKAKIGIDVIKTVKITFRNVKVFELTRDQIKAGQQNQDPNCTAVVKEALARGEKLTMITSALKADASYAMTFSSEFKFDVSVAQQIAKGLGVDAQSVTGTSSSVNVNAEQLFWGVREISRPEAAGLEAPVPRGDGRPEPIPVKGYVTADLAAAPIEVRTRPSFVE